jgi:hypothetical protein
MTIQPVIRFWCDQRGGGTIFGLLWFIVLVGICGLAVDITDGFRSRTMLQSTADSSALAGAIDLPVTNDVVLTAVDYAEDNMAIVGYGSVLMSEDVTIGAWEHETRTFIPESSVAPGIPLDAVHVMVHQGADNDNALATNFLRIIGLRSWNVKAQAVAQRFIPECLRDGLVAAEIVDMSSNNGFVNGICIHGNEGVNIQSNNYFELGVNVSMPRLSMLEVGGSGMESNPGLPEALREDILSPRDVNHTQEIMTSYLDPATAPFLPGYITATQTSDLIELTATQFDWADVLPGHVHYVSCKNDQQLLNIPEGYVLSNVVIIADCKIHFGANAVVFNAVIGSRASHNLRSAQNPKEAREGASMVTAAGVQLGMPDNCTAGGGMQLFSNSGMHFSSSTTFDGVQIVAAGDVHLGARDMGINGISVQSAKTIYLESNNMFGLCSGGAPNDFWVPYYRLVL